MPMIQMRDVPDHIYRLLAEQAEKDRRSLAQQALAVLARGLDTGLNPRARRKKVLQALPASPPLQFRRLSDPVKLIRKDRQR